MDKIEETRDFLDHIGMPKAQQADICCYVILAMAGIKPDMQLFSSQILIMELHMLKIAGKHSENRHYIISVQQHWWKIMERLQIVRTIGTG